MGREPAWREVRRGRLGSLARAVHGSDGEGQEEQRPRQHLRQPQGCRRRRSHAHVMKFLILLASSVLNCLILTAVSPPYITWMKDTQFQCRKVRKEKAQHMVGLEPKKTPSLTAILQPLLRNTSLTFKNLTSSFQGQIDAESVPGSTVPLYRSLLVEWSLLRSRMVLIHLNRFQAHVGGQGGRNASRHPVEHAGGPLRARQVPVGLGHQVPRKLAERKILRQ